MTNLEQALANILSSIETAKIAGNSLALASLSQRKDVICAALAAPEHSLHNPRAQASADVVELEPASQIVMPLVD